MTTRTTQPNVAATYFPGPGNDWERRTPEQVGMDPDLLQRAIDYSTEPSREGHLRDLAEQIRQNNAGKQYDDGATLGPTKTRGAVTGVVLRNGYLVAEWGEPERVDMTFSVTKSFLSTVAGLAYDRGLICDVHDKVAGYVDDGGYDSPHNARITWDHSLRQISEWDGTLWDKHYSAGNHEDLFRPVEEPGTAYEYNDVRVNRFSLSLLRVWKRPLPEVLKEHVMDPIDASDTWKWNGYRNSWVDVDGEQHVVRQRRRTLGRRHVDIRPRPGPLRPAVPQARRVEGQAAPLPQVGRHGNHAHAHTAHLRLHELVPQHRSRPHAQRPRKQLLPPRRRRQQDMGRPRARPRCRPPLGSHRALRRLRQASPSLHSVGACVAPSPSTL